MSGEFQAGRPRGGVQPSHCQNIFLKNQKKKKMKNLETQKQNKNQGNMLHFNQAIVLLWCSHYDIIINDGPEPAQTGGETLKK